MLIRINLIDCFASSTKVKVDSTKTANDVCEVLSTKLGLGETDVMFFGLVCVAKCVVNKKNMHWIRTLKATERVLQVQADMEDKAIGRCPTAEIARTVTSSFYYKDIRSDPLELDGEASGNSSSDDEVEIPLNDFIYFGSGERRGFLQKRSSRDPNVWRRRLCILNDKMWCVNARKNVPWGSCLSLSDMTVMGDRPDIKYTNTIALGGNDGHTLFFRTNTPLERHRWREELKEKTVHGADNAVIMMAEIILTDEEAAGESIRQKCLLEVLQTPRVWKAVQNILNISSQSNICGQVDCEIGDKKSIDVQNRHRSQTAAVARSGCIEEYHRPRNNSLLSDVDSRGFHYADGTLSNTIEMNSQVLIPEVSKKFGRWPHQIFHVLHQRYPACAAAISLISAVQHYKNSFRHDYCVSTTDLWGNALHVYLDYILKHIDKVKNPVETDCARTESVEEVRQESADRCSSSNDKQELFSRDSEIYHISMDEVTKLRRELFSNIRKIRKEENVDNSDANLAKEKSSSSSSWFWSSSFERSKSMSDSAKESGEANKNEIFNTNYEVIDGSIRPSVDMFDSIVQNMFKKLEDST